MTDYETPSIGGRQVSQSPVTCRLSAELFGNSDNDSGGTASLVDENSVNDSVKPSSDDNDDEEETVQEELVPCDLCGAIGPTFHLANENADICEKCYTNTVPCDYCGARGPTCHVTANNVNICEKCIADSLTGSLTDRTPRSTTSTSNGPGCGDGDDGGGGGNGPG
jgi:hypothetical protein